MSSNPNLDSLREQLAADSISNPTNLLTQAMQSGQPGLELVLEALYHPAIPVKLAAYEILHDRPEPEIQWKRLWYTPYQVIQKQFEIPRLYPEKGSYTQFAITPDSRGLLVVDYYGNLHLWDLKTGNLIHTLPGDGSFGSSAPWVAPKLLGAIALHPQGQTVWIATWDGTLQERDWMTGEIKRTFQSGARYIHSLSLDAAGRFLLLGSRNSYGSELWDLTTGKLQRPFKKSKEQSEVSVAIAPDASVLATNTGKIVKLWDLQGNLLHAFSGISVAFTPDSQAIVISGGEPQPLQVWQVKTGECLRQFHEPDSLQNLCVTSDGQAVVLRCYEAIKIRSLTTGELLNSVTHRSSGANAIAISPDQYKLVAGDIQIFSARSTVVWGAEVSTAAQLTSLHNVVTWRRDFDPRFQLTCYTEEALIRDYCRLATEFGLAIVVDEIRERVARIERLGYYQYIVGYKRRTLPWQDLDMNRPDIDEKHPILMPSDWLKNAPYSATEMFFD